MYLGDHRPADGSQLEAPGGSAEVPAPHLHSHPHAMAAWHGGVAGARRPRPMGVPCCPKVAEQGGAGAGDGGTRLPKESGSRLAEPKP